MNPCLRARFGALIAAAVFAGCASPPMTLPGPVDYPRSPAPAGLSLGTTPAQRPTTTVVTDLPAAPIRPDVTGAAPAAVRPAAPGEEVSMAIEQTPLPMFIQILYGNVLKLPYSMDQSINSRTDVVTFKTSRPIERARLQEVAVNLLRSYQLSVQDLGGVIRIVPESAAGAAAPATLRTGKTLPDTPDSLRLIHQHVEVDVVKASDISQWLRQILGNRVQVTDDSSRNGILLSGTTSDLRIALDLIKTLDQPRLRGRVAKRITPAFMNTNELSARLNDVLTAQGYGVAVGQLTSVPILIIPVNAIGSLIIFATNDEVMDHAIKWARELDRPLSVQTQNSIYTYAVKYADAQELARTLGEILTGSGGQQQAPLPVAGAAPGSGTAPTAPSRSSSNNRVVVNSPTNTLIIRGTTAEEYQQIMSLLRELDRPVKSALIEVVVAELRLGGSQALGIEWNITPRSLNGGSVQGGTLGRLGVGSAGLTLGFANAAGQLVAILNTLASNNQARILSNPKVLARNGETASIQVGQEVPVVTSQQSSGTTGSLFGGTGGVLQSIQYRSVGVILKVRPVINSGNRLDLEVSQEVSSAAETRTGVSASPTISTRRIDTKLSLRDGSTVLLGGLISKSQSDANTGIPYLKDIPGLGALFRTQSDSNDQTELLIMITPYVISDDFESEAITDAIMKTFGGWSQDIRPARVTPLQPSSTGPAAGSTESPVGGSAPAAAAGTTKDMPTPGPAAPPSGSLQLPSATSTPAPRPAGATAQSPSVAPARMDGPKVDDGITVSRPPQPASSSAGATAPAQETTPAGAPQPTGPASAPRAQDGARSPGQPGAAVSDPQIRKEIEELLKSQPKPK